MKTESKINEKTLNRWNKSSGKFIDHMEKAIESYHYNVKYLYELSTQFYPFNHYT